MWFTSIRFAETRAGWSRGGDRKLSFAIRALIADKLKERSEIFGSLR
jgi:hypothetical protein